MARLRVRLAVTCSATAVVSALVAPTAAVAQQGATATPRQTFEWAALGDSYTAGVIRSAGEEFEAPPRDGCVRTTRSYPEVIKRDLGPLVHLTNVSCGDAKVANIADVGQFPIGRHLPPLSEDPDYPFAQVDPQLDRVSPDTDVITVGIGGNTLGFGEILTTCLALGKETGDVGAPCRDHFTNDAGGDTIEQRLVELGAEYDQMLTDIHARAPHAKVITVGYPYVIPEDVTSCIYGSLVGFGTVTHDDLRWLRPNVLEPLNTVIHNETVRHGDTFVDIYTSGRGHSVCDKAGGNNWVDGIFSTLLPAEVGFVHPNAKGHANAATHVEAAIINALGIG